MPGIDEPSVSGRFRVWHKDAPGPGETPLRQISNPAYFGPAQSEISFPEEFSFPSEHMIPSFTQMGTDLNLQEYIQGKQSVLLNRRRRIENECSSMAHGQPVFYADSGEEFCRILSSSYPEFGIDIKEFGTSLSYELVVSGQFSSPKSFVPIYHATRTVYNDNSTSSIECAAAGMQTIF
jgi:hypothetical protein